MGLDATVVISTFGDPGWLDLAYERAVTSARMFDLPLVFVHGATLHEARNAGLTQVRTEWICYLDADDELEPGYFERMADAEADLRVPSVRYVKNKFDQGVRMPKVAGHVHDCTADCLPEGNWCVIGTVARAETLRAAGGFRDFEWSEDWDLWLRCWQAGATVEAVPRAVYRAHVRRDSRNRGQSQEAKNAAHRAIAEANNVPSPV